MLEIRILRRFLVFLIIFQACFQPVRADSLSVVVLGSFSSPKNAEQLRSSEQQYTDELLNVNQVYLGGPLYRVTTRPFSSIAQARALLSLIRRRVPDAWLNTKPLKPSPHDDLTMASNPITTESTLATTEGTPSATIFIQHFEQADDALQFALSLSKRYSMPVLIEPSLEPSLEPSREAGVGSPGSGFRIRSLPVDPAVSPLLLEMITREFPSAFLIP